MTRHMEDAASPARHRPERGAGHTAEHPAEHSKEHTAKKIKLLFITCDFEGHVLNSLHDLACALSQLTQCCIWTEAGDIRDILSRQPFEPDFILLNDLRDDHCPPITGLRTLSIPFGILMHDLHWGPEYRKKFIRDNGVQYIFSHYRDAFYAWYSEFSV
ncbi:MAG: hypothetical protein K6T30_01340 [Alicyclobacillus sp.]|nr:hypothetical protein [Alicyclobacillus sp.]